MRPASPDTGSRLFIVDWLRILALFVLILYHIGMLDLSWGWHVKSQFASDAIEPLMLLSAPWRPGLLFMIAGAASSLMLTNMSTSAFIGQRSHRLLIPLLCGMLVVVPPQTYLEVVEKVAYQSAHFDFMKLYLTAFHGFCRDYSCLIMPTRKHLCFLACLWIRMLLLGALVLALGAHFTTLARRSAQLLTDWRLIVLPLAMLAVARNVLLARLPEPHKLAWDWDNLADYFFLFLLGALLAPRPAFWERLDALRW